MRSPEARAARRKASVKPAAGRGHGAEWAEKRAGESGFEAGGERRTRRAREGVFVAAESGSPGAWASAARGGLGGRVRRAGSPQRRALPFSQSRLSIYLSKTIYLPPRRFAAWGWSIAGLSNQLS